MKQQVKELMDVIKGINSPDNAIVLLDAMDRIKTLDTLITTHTEESDKLLVDNASLKDQVHKLYLRATATTPTEILKEEPSALDALSDAIKKGELW